MNIYKGYKDAGSLRAMHKQIAVAFQTGQLTWDSTQKKESLLEQGINADILRRLAADNLFTLALLGGRRLYLDTRQWNMGKRLWRVR